MFLPYSRQDISFSDIWSVLKVLRSDFLTTGAQVGLFEENLCKATHASRAVVCSSGTTALHLAAAVLDLKEGEAAIVPSQTFLATANAVRYCGAEVIFCDCDPETGLMGPDHFEEAIARTLKNLKLKAVFPVHLTGQAVDLKALRPIADKHNMAIVADGSHILGAELYGKPIGENDYADMTTLSFHPVKPITTAEGGAVITNNKDYADKAELLRSHGMARSTDPNTPWAYEMDMMGYNYRLNDVQCAMGSAQLKKLRSYTNKRVELADLYDDLLEPLSSFVKPPKRVDYGRSAWHLYAARFDFKKIGIERGPLMNALKEKSIGSQVHYIPVHSQPYYKKRYGALDLLGTNTYYQNTLSIPLYPRMSAQNVRYVVDTLKEIIEDASTS